MAIGISVTGDALLGYVITVTDANQGDRVRVYREDTTGHYPDAGVREIDMVAPTGGTMVVIDYEAPFNCGLKFHAEAYDVSDLETPIATAVTSPIDTVLPSGFAIITDPLDADLRIAVAVADLREWDYSTRVLGRHEVLGRSNAVTNTDVESGRSGSMVISNLEQFGIDWDGTGPYTPYTIVAHANWNTIFRSGRTLLFRNSWHESGFDDLYFKALSRKTTRIGHVGAEFVNNKHNVWLAQSVSFEEQDRPSTTLLGLGLGTWQDVYDNNADWQEVLDDHADWTSVLVSPDL